MAKPITALIIMDGFGNGRPDPKSNAIYAANTPNLDRYKRDYSVTEIGASGLNVGLPDDVTVYFLHHIQNDDVTGRVKAKTIGSPARWSARRPTWASRSIPTWTGWLSSVKTACPSAKNIRSWP